MSIKDNFMKNDSLTISIPKPCHENWATMTPVEKGRFCTTCQKQVMDFTRMGDREIAGILKKDSNVCARIKPSQADRELIIPHYRKNHAAAIAAVALLAASPAVGYAQTPVETEQQPVDHDYEILGKVAATPVNIINGTVVDENKLPIPGANIVKVGTTQTVITDLDGKFNVDANQHDVLEISCLGYEPLKVIVNQRDFTTPLIIYSTSEVILGEIAVRRTFFGRIFYRIGNLFR
ncbi:carboxypeptidase-like regulatory domain-containing protein [Flavobacterium sp. RHBU_24]|uniref:carboxypeptidase-like regulatory domain-containing protein n=1 Tax=Flavobacterium sp. RHBU_24 TaxID=3391185 RepID=UPI0039856509